MVTETLSIGAVVGGYQVYQDSWDPAIGEQLPCKREPGLGTIRTSLLRQWWDHVLPSMMCPRSYQVFVLCVGTIHCQVIF